MPAVAAVALDPTKIGREAQKLEESLRGLIVGQDEAIKQIVNIYQMYQTALSPPDRPIGNFLFLGPTGSGKTRIVEATAEILVGTARALIKIDCAEFQHSHEIAKLIGSPPGYLGHRETHPLLSQEIINQYHTERVKVSFILFDEIEKASDALWNLLLGILDKATLTLGDNRKVDFSRAMIFLTSNLGTGEMSSIMSPKLGFPTIKPAQTGQGLDGKTEGKVTRSAMEAARRKFTSEFMNRLDKIVVFKSLGTRELRRILDIELRMVQQRVFHSWGDRSFLFTVTDAVREHLLVEGTDTSYGARHLKRAIERLVVQPISNLIASDQVAPGDWVKVDFDHTNRGLRFLKEAEGMSLHIMAQVANTPLAALAASAGSGSGREPPETAPKTVGFRSKKNRT
ncbi:MAG: AAA family ATPase [Patescibacteria group bacterium]